MKLVVINLKKDGVDKLINRLFLVKSETVANNLSANNYLLSNDETLVSTRIIDDSDFFKDSNCGLFQIGDVLDN